MQFFEFDVCSLKADTSFVGTVERTHYNPNDNEPIDDFLIIAHPAIPTFHSDVYQLFLTSGIPPPGTVFVAWSRQEHGRSLVADQDLHLVDRPYMIGDTVKRNFGDAMSGIVIDVSETFTLFPVCFQDGRTLFKCGPDTDLPHAPHPRLPDSVSHPYPHRLLFDIPAEELKIAERVTEEDYVIHNHWLGIVTDCPTDDVTLLLGDGSVVQVWDALDLELPIPDSQGSLIQVPQRPPDRERPGINISHRDGGQYRSFAPDRIQVGQELVTSKHNLRSGVYVRGMYKPTVEPRGTVLEVRPSEIHVQWLCPNVFGENVDKRPPRSDWRSNAPPTSLELAGSILSDFKGMMVYDRRKMPSPSQSSEGVAPRSTGHDLGVGDRVKFRDLAGASAKYPNENNEHGIFQRISTSMTYGFDLNEFQIVRTRTEVTVQWQDQTVTREPAIGLRKLVIFEVELSPGDIVSLKEKTEQISATSGERVQFNEAMFEEGDYHLRLNKLGVVQSVNSKERLAQVRWYQGPNVVLTSRAQVLVTGSTLGPISDQIDEVSLYEIMEHPALTKRRRDIVLLPPESYSLVAHGSWTNNSTRNVGTSLLSFIESARPGKIFSHLSRLRHYMLSTILSRPEEGRVVQGGDWLGEIVDLGLDGEITVRLGALPKCRDVKISLERILLVVDEAAVVDELDPFDDRGDFFGDYASEQSIEPIEETVEYDGGQRLDQDSGDEMWETDEESPSNPSHFESDGTNTETDDSMIDDGPSREEISAPAVVQAIFIGATDAPEVSPVQSETTSSGVRIPFANQEMPQFDVLEEPPPAHHRFLSSPASSSPALLRRLMKEHKILSTSLPEGVYARTWQSRLDLLRVLIVGPLDTPYELAPFIIDFYFDSSFPRTPPHAHFHSWTYGVGKINPNLYEEGKICLSLLGTWPGKSPDENWSDKASVLQILVSLMGLVLVKNPFYNEAGFEDFASEGSSRPEAVQYTEKAFVMARGFVKHALNHSIPGFDDVIAWLYCPIAPSPGSTNTVKAPNLLRQVIDRANAMIKHHHLTTGGDVAMGDKLGPKGNKKDASVFISRLSRGAVVMLRKHIGALEELMYEAGVEPWDDATQRRQKRTMQLRLSDDAAAAGKD